MTDVAPTGYVTRETVAALRWGVGRRPPFWEKRIPNLHCDLQRSPSRGVFRARSRERRMTRRLLPDMGQYLAQRASSEGATAT